MFNEAIPKYVKTVKFDILQDSGRLDKNNPDRKVLGRKAVLSK